MNKEQWLDEIRRRFVIKAKANGEASKNMEERQPMSSAWSDGVFTGIMLALNEVEEMKESLTEV